jgi:hypothetical protein
LEVAKLQIKKPNNREPITSSSTAVKDPDHITFEIPLKTSEVSGFLSDPSDAVLTVEILPYWNKYFMVILKNYF